MTAQEWTRYWLWKLGAALRAKDWPMVRIAARRLRALGK